ncbi:hypothetical protein PU629_07660 [Pullulanibacillus sp. KACC 23026]|uniref:hypothetical protein n=1 Tax=Pullulanibacillus sp. KACC 23026 TaxID=3028315 RepID=UPI0023AEAD5B|nr:hypothetical protein [Pullulanibacillus sp. KACC 23026]WEG14230.1 hypothetical protein PU629_07660 [Pullulanibacillus sp. KACC 23026]
MNAKKSGWSIRKGVHWMYERQKSEWSIRKVVHRVYERQKERVEHPKSRSSGV